jgi:hypothetical protein
LPPRMSTIPAPSTVNPLTYLTYVLANVRNKSITIQTPDEFTVSNIAHVG